MPRKAPRSAAPLRLRFHSWPALAAALTVVLFSPSVFADLIEPTAWSRNDPNATYQQWDSFSFAQGPNPPDTGNQNPNGFADAFDSSQESSNSFVTSGGNIYSFSGVITPRAIVPAFSASPGDTTRFFIQVRSFGSIIDTTIENALTVNGVDVATLPGYAYEELSRDESNLEPFGTVGLIQHLWTFDVDASLVAGVGDSFMLDWSWGVSSASLDQLVIDTFVEASAGSVPGDYNNSGVVEQGDLNLVLNNWGLDTTDSVPEGWINHLPEGIIDQAELNGVLSNWGDGGVTPSFRPSTVPEPAAAALVAVVCGWLGRPRRIRSQPRD
ncbi:MAG: hypothetical protein AAGE65_04235 [Planctomycetota bacterium]